MLSAGAFLFSTGVSAADAGTGQQSGSAIIPLLVVGTGTVLWIFPLFSLRLYSRRSAQAIIISHFQH